MSRPDSQTGKIIVFSGLDGAGKTTQIELLQTYLRKSSIEHRYIWTRGGYTVTFEKLKGVIRRLSAKRAIPESGPSEQRTQTFNRPIVRKLWLKLAILDLMWVYGLQIRWWRRLGRIVICDRYLWDTLVDFRLNYPQDNVESWYLWQILAGITPRPQASFLLMIPVGESVKRSEIKGEPFRDSPEVLSKRLAQYEELAQNGFWQVLDGYRPVDDLAEEIRQGVEP